MNNNSDEISKIVAVVDELGITKIRLWSHYALGKGMYVKVSKAYSFDDNAKVTDAELTALIEVIKIGRVRGKRNIE